VITAIAGLTLAVLDLLLAIFVIIPLRRRLNSNSTWTRHWQSETRRAQHDLEQAQHRLRECKESAASLMGRLDELKDERDSYVRAEQLATTCYRKLGVHHDKVMTACRRLLSTWQAIPFTTIGRRAAIEALTTALEPEDGVVIVDENAIEGGEDPGEWRTL
jgi:chromosome segregation ATPase